MSGKIENSERLLAEELVTPAEAARDVFQGKVSAQSVYRWMATGVSGVRLESVRFDRKRLTTRQAIHRFISRMGRDEPEPAQPLKTKAPKHRRSRAAEAEGAGV